MHVVSMPRAARTSKIKPPKTFRHSPHTPEAVQAVQVAILTMKAAGVKRWSELVEKPIADVRAKVNLDPEQQSLLEKHAHLLRYIQISPLISIAGCDACGRYGLAASANVSAKCGFTRGCTGKVVKASSLEYKGPKAVPAADAAPAPEDEPADAPLESQLPPADASDDGGDFLDTLFFGDEGI